MIEDRHTHTHRQTDTVITILRSPIAGAVTNPLNINSELVLQASTQNVLVRMILVHPAHYAFLTIMFCSGAVLDPRVDHTTDVLSPFIPVLCHSD